MKIARVVCRVSDPKMTRNLLSEMVRKTQNAVGIKWRMTRAGFPGLIKTLTLKAATNITLAALYYRNELKAGINIGPMIHSRSADLCILCCFGNHAYLAVYFSPGSDVSTVQ